jgi:hypothetical protein
VGKLKRITEVKAGVLVVGWEFDDLVVDAMGEAWLMSWSRLIIMLFQVVKVHTMTTGCFQRSQ